MVNRFKWATDKPGKQMFFVGWIHADSPDPGRRSGPSPLGNGVPNTIPMYDDGTNGDEQANDNVWTLTVDLPRGIRLGYKYTWGTRGAPWTGSEEWPGNSRLLEVVDVGGDNFVYRRDVFGDEATNKDKANLNGSLSGNVITWTTDLHGGLCGAPEVHEQKFADASMCLCAFDLAHADVRGAPHRGLHGPMTPAPGSVTGRPRSRKEQHLMKRILVTSPPWPRSAWWPAATKPTPRRMPTPTARPRPGRPTRSPPAPSRSPSR